MTNDHKTDTIPASDGIATSHRGQRLRHALAIANLALLPILLTLFLSLIVDRRMQPMYSWIEDTPIVDFVQNAGRLYSGRAFKLAQGVQADRRVEAEAIIARMEARMPDAVAVTNAGQVIFGRLAGKNAKGIQLVAVDGRLNERRDIPFEDLREARHFAVQPAKLTARDAEFLLNSSTSAHFCLPPMLVVTDGGFGDVNHLYITLQLLEEDFREVFRTIATTPASSDDMLHIALVPRGTVRMAAAQALTVSDAWYDSLNRELVVAAGVDETDRQRLIRHEGTHELCDRFNLLARFDTAPLWLREGLAQYFESRPPGSDLSPIRVPEDGRSIPWDDLLAPTSLAQLPENVTPELFYAQSAFLVYWLMAPARRPRFIRLLSNLPENPAAVRSLVPLMNAVDETASKLQEEFRTGQARSGP